MSETIDIRAEIRGNSDLSWALLRAMTGDGLPLDESLAAEVRDSGTIQVDLRINGREMSFSNVIRRMKVEFDRHVVFQAKEMLNERSNDSLVKVTRLFDSVDEAIVEIAKKWEADRG